MTTHPKSAAEAWGRLERSAMQPVSLRMGGDGTPELYYEVTTSGQWSLLALADRYPGRLPVSSRACMVECREFDSHVCVRVVLVEQELSAVFLRLADAVADRAKQSGPKVRPEALLLGEFMRWRHMLSPASNATLSNAQQLGLMGELSYLVHLLGTGLSPLDCVASWKGPAGADQDFHHASGLVEVKAIEYGNAMVSISSLEQLDGSGCALHLVIYSFQSDTSAVNGTSLNGLVERVNELLDADPHALYEFSEKLERLGFLRNSEYATIRRVLRDVSIFSVDGAFPALLRSQVPAGIVSASYELAIGSLPNRCLRLP